LNEEAIRLPYYSTSLKTHGKAGLLMGKGKIQVYTGDGKGKTTAALGLALRASGWGMRIAFFQFLKGRSTGEAEMGLKLGWDFRQFATGRWFIDSLPDEQEKMMAGEGIKATVNSFQENDIVVLDEISHALNSGLIQREEFLQVLAKKPKGIELVLTGRNMPDYVLEKADLVTEMKMIKHPFERGEIARKGVEF
jgi:cob(I)alamin adenosyltransferase